MQVRPFDDVVRTRIYTPPLHPRSSHPLRLQVAGYALLNVFALAGAASSLDQPGVSRSPEGSVSVQPTSAPLVLNAGAFQLPLFQVPPPKGDGSPPLSILSLDGPRVPCATVLVRLLPLARPREGHRGAAFALLSPPPPPPLYDSGAYDSTRCRPLPAEAALYPKRALMQVRVYLF